MTDIATARPALQPGLLQLLQCPRCHRELTSSGERSLTCAGGHRYPIVDGIPVFILEEEAQTIGIASASLEAAAGGGGPLYIETLGLSEAEKAGVGTQWEEAADGSIDPVVSHLVGATSGLGYASLIGRMKTYPIPRIPIGPGEGEWLLDLGCGWGRWSIAAARNGWSVVGIDPSLGALMAARRAFGNEPRVLFVCGDARFLPFHDETFRCVFSYSVVQHFSEADAERAFAEVGRVLQRNGYSRIQMAHRGGLRARYILARALVERGIFDVRYWSLDRLKEVAAQRIGPSRVEPEAFGGLGLLSEDWHFVSPSAKLLIAASALLRSLARLMRSLISLADSVYVVSVKR